MNKTTVQIKLDKVLNRFKMDTKAWVESISYFRIR